MYQSNKQEAIKNQFDCMFVDGEMFARLQS